MPRTDPQPIATLGKIICLHYTLLSLFEKSTTTKKQLSIDSCELTPKMVRYDRTWIWIWRCGPA